MTYHLLPVRTAGSCDFFFTNLAVRRPPIAYEQLLPPHRLVPLHGEVTAACRLATDELAQATHNDLINLIQLVDAYGFEVAQDQSLLFRDRHFASQFDRPVVLNDEFGNVLVLDYRKRPPNSTGIATIVSNDPLKTLGWSAGMAGGKDSSDGCYLRLSSPTLSIEEIAEVTSRAEVNLNPL